VEIIVTGRNVEVTPGLRDHVSQKARRLQRLLRPGAEVRVVASVQKESNVVEVTVHLDSFTFRAEGSSNDMYQAVDLALSKLRRQIAKLKDRWQDHSRGEAAPKAARLSAEALSELQESYQPNIAVRRTYTRKPMTVEEACLQLEMTGVEFLPFVSLDTGEVHVVYRVGEDRYGILRPEGT